MKKFSLTFISLFTLNTYANSCEKYKADLLNIKSCSPKSVHLTFDDGPNTNTTPKVLQTLKRQNTPSTFFISTHQLEKGDLTNKKKILKDMLKHGHTIASHGHDHNCHDIRYDWKGNLEDGYNDNQRREQVSKSIYLLDKFTDNEFSKQELQLIRFPYGRGISPSPKEIEKMIRDGRDIRGSNYAEKLKYYRNHSPAMSIASEYKLSHVGWNHDSKDATTKYGLKNKDEYIKFQLDSFCSSSATNIMTLYHDTRSINSSPSKYDSSKTVLDEIIEKAKCLGIKFVPAKNILSKDLQSGVYTKSYNIKSQTKKIISEVESINSPNNPTCNSKIKTMSSKHESCYSEYVGEVEHCQGNESFCIDGQWIKSAKLYQATCKGSLSSETAKILSSQYLDKSCEGKKSEIIEIEKAKCYCQFRGKDLKWNCHDISSGKAQALF